MSDSDERRRLAEAAIAEWDAAVTIAAQIRIAMEPSARSAWKESTSPEQTIADLDRIAELEAEMDRLLAEQLPPWHLRDDEGRVWRATTPHHHPHEWSDDPNQGKWHTVSLYRLVPVESEADNG